MRCQDLVAFMQMQHKRGTDDMPHVLLSLFEYLDNAPIQNIISVLGGTETINKPDCLWRTSAQSDVYFLHYLCQHCRNRASTELVSRILVSVRLSYVPTAHIFTILLLDTLYHIEKKTTVSHGQLHNYTRHYNTGDYSSLVKVK